ncbi:hypothetical protein RSAG8_13578, partial [Rhizoctonia solani AG-8 WAC10335]
MGTIAWWWMEMRPNSLTATRPPNQTERMECTESLCSPERAWKTQHTPWY